MLKDLFKKITPAVMPVAAFASALAMTSTPANDAVAQTATSTPVSSNTVTAQSFAIGQPIPIAEYSVRAQQLQQSSIARMDFIYEGKNGQPHTARAAYITINPETSRGWILLADAPQGSVTTVTPILEIANVVMFRHMTPGAGVNNLINAYPTRDPDAAIADCQRWTQTLTNSLSCIHKNAFYNSAMAQMVSIAVAGNIVNGNPRDASVFSILYMPDQNTGIFGRMGANAHISEHVVGNYSIYPMVEAAFADNPRAPVAYIPRQSAPITQNAALSP